MAWKDDVPAPTRTLWLSLLLLGGACDGLVGPLSPDGGDAGAAGATDGGGGGVGGGAGDGPGGGAAGGGGGGGGLGGGGGGETHWDGGAGCASLAATKESGSTAYRWSDSRCAGRALSTDDTRGLVTSVTYKVDGADRVCGKTGSSYQGLGYLISDTGLGNCSVTPTVSQPLQGAHHAIHRFSRPTGCAADVNVELFFATGRDHPIIAVSFDTTSSTKSGDSRFPYGELQFDGASNGDNAVSGLGWGDTYKFRTTTALRELATTGWDYTARNTIPYDLMWIDDPDAEIGLVQTQTYVQQDAGGYDFGGGSSTSQYYGKASANGPLPPVVLWPYQLNQYSTPDGSDESTPWYTTSKRFAWGTHHDAIGSASYTGVDGTARSGKPHFGYALFLVLGQHSQAVTEKAVQQIEAVQGSTLTAQIGTVLTQGPVGAGRAALTPFRPVGYNHVYSTWEIAAQGNRAAVTLTTPAGLLNPILVIHDYDSPADPVVAIDGTPLISNRGYFASRDAAGKVLWVTLFGTVVGARVISIEPKP